jgi:hypothetical protein
MNTILTNREYQIEGNWYSPTNHLNQYKSILKAILLNTSSSAGDWDGILFQLINGKVYGIPFSQENNWPGSDGFTLYTGEAFISFDYSIYHENIMKQIIHEYCEITYLI